MRTTITLLNLLVEFFFFFFLFWRSRIFEVKKDFWISDEKKLKVKLFGKMKIKYKARGWEPSLLNSFIFLIYYGVHLMKPKLPNYEIDYVFRINFFLHINRCLWIMWHLSFLLRVFISFSVFYISHFSIHLLKEWDTTFLIFVQFSSYYVIAFLIIIFFREIRFIIMSNVLDHNACPCSTRTHRLWFRFQCLILWHAWCIVVPS